jgi:glucose-6-phosphate 1-dehydrogenase
MATIEALIDQHKQNMRAEDESNKQLAANAAIKAMVKDVSKKYDDVKSILDKKSNDALAYLSLAAEMSRCVTNTVKLTKEYQEFTSFAAAHAGSKPMVAWYTLRLITRSIRN